MPRLVFAIMPGGIASDAKSRGVVLRDLSKIPSETLVITVIGDRDARAADLAAKRLLREASGVAPERKLFIRALSDDHGFPSLTATLTSPGAVDTAYDGGAIKLPPEPPKDPKQPPTPFKWAADMSLTGEQTTLLAQLNNSRADSLDYLAYWKTFDLAAAAAFGGDATTLKANPRLSDMERWERRLAGEASGRGNAPCCSGGRACAGSDACGGHAIQAQTGETSLIHHARDESGFRRGAPGLVIPVAFRKQQAGMVLCLRNELYRSR